MSKNVLAIDIGSTKICAIIANIDDERNISIIGAGSCKAVGLKRGSITNIELASRSIKTAVNNAQRVAGTEIRSAVVSISGVYTKSLNSSGIVNIQSKEISFKEIEKVMRNSLYNANIPNEYEALHTLPFNFKVDDQSFIEDPLGMNASRLEVETHIITTQKSNLNNLKRAVKGAGIEVDNIVLSSYASSIAVLKEDEKELGVVVIDMGGNTSNIAIHSGNSLKYNDFLGVGSNHITSDLSIALHTPLNIADKVKLEYGSLLAQTSDLIEIPTIGDEDTTQSVSLDVVHNVIYARVQETLMILAQFIEQSGLKEQIGAGVVMTGGFSKMDGIRELAVATFGSMPVRLGKPVEMDGLFEDLRDAEYSAAVGLIMYAASYYTPYEIDVNKRVRHKDEMDTEEIDVNFNNNNNIPVANESKDVEKETNNMIVLPDNKETKNETGILNKFWHKATQLF